MAALTGGDKLEKVLASIGENVDGGLKVGFLSGATYPNGTSVAQVAFWVEYGHGGTFPAPPRPFFRRMVNEHSKGWALTLARAIKYTEYDGGKALKIMGEHIKGQLQDSIINFDGGELSPTSLILRKKFWTNPEDIRARDVLDAQEAVNNGEKGASGTQAKPLVWTGHMLNSIDYEVDQ